MDLDRLVVVCRSSEGLDLGMGLGDAELEVEKQAWRRILGGGCGSEATGWNKRSAS